MNYLNNTARILLGLMFTGFGLNGFSHLIPPPPPVSPMTLQCMLIAMLLLLTSRFSALALTPTAPILINVLPCHGVVNLQGIGAGGLATLLWAVVFWRERSAFAGLFWKATPVVA